MANKGLFKNIDYQNKVTPTPLERNDVHVDRSHDFYNNIIDAANVFLYDFEIFNFGISFNKIKALKIFIIQKEALL